MSYNDAKSLIGSSVRLRWLGHRGDEEMGRVHVFNVGMVPRSGPCLITDQGEIRLDAITRVEAKNRKHVA